VKIATFNINDINKRLQNLLAWLEKTEPDVVCLQELKAEQQAFPLLYSNANMASVMICQSAGGPLLQSTNCPRPRFGSDESNE